MAFRDSLKKYRESQGYQPTTSNTTSEEEKKTGSEPSVSTGTSFRDKLKKYREEASSKSLSAWGNTAYALMLDVQNNASKWHGETDYKSRRTQASKLLGLADSWRKQYAGNEEAINYINSVVAALEDADRVSFSGYKFFSNFKDEDDYNFWDSRNTVEKRQKLYEDNSKKIADLESEKEAMGFVFPWLDSDWKRKTEIDDEIARLQAENNNYERGNVNENGRFYGSKVTDDNYMVSLADDFAITSANRDYANPTKEDFAQYDAYNDSSSWYFDANGVYRDAYGNALEVDESGNWVNPKAKDFQVEDKLGLFLNTSDDELVEAAGNTVGSEGTWASIIKDGLDGSWKYLDETEKGIYYTYLGESQEKAYQYLADMKTELNRRQTLDELGQWDKAYDEANLLEKIAMNAATVPAKFVSGIAGTIDNAANTMMGNDINPYSAAQSGMHFSQSVRGNTAEELDKTGLKIPVLDFTLGDVYQTGMSRLDSLAATKVFGGGGTIFLGMGAAQEEAYRLYQQGASADQITVGAFAAGAAEAIWEYVSFGKLNEIKDVDTKFKWVKSILIQGWNEASEEALTEVSNIITNALVMGSQSDLAELYKENKESAFWTFVDLLQQTAQSAFGGFLGGVGAGAIQSTGAYVDTTSRYRDAGRTIMSAEGGVQGLQDIAYDVANKLDGKLQKSLTKQAGGVSSEIATGKGIGKIGAAIKNYNNATKTGRLYNTVQTANKVANTSANQADIAKSLQRNGFNAETANDLASALVAQYNGQELTKAQQKLLKSVEDSKYVKKAISDILENVKSTVGQRQQNIRDFQQDVSDGRIARMAGVSVDTVKKAKQGIYAPAAKNATEGSYEVSAEGKTILKSSGDTVNIKKIASIKKGQMVFETDNGTVNASDVSYATKDEALVYEAVASLGGIINADDANRLVQGFSKAKGMSAAVYARGVAQAYTYGYYGYSMADALGKDTMSSALTESQRNTAFAFGRVQRKADVAKAQEERSKYKEAAEKTGKTGKKGGVYFRSNGMEVSDIDSYMEKAGTVLKDVQKVSIETMKNLSEALGIEFVVYESYVKDGKRYYIDEDGVEQAGAPNGWYDQKTGKVYIDLHAGNNAQGAMLFTIAHELTHFIHQWSPAKFAKLADIIFSHGNMKGNVAALVAQKMLKAEARGKPISEAVAYEEVVADGMESILKSGRVVEMVADIKQQDRGLWQKICEWFKDLADYMKRVVDAYRGKDPDSVEGKMVAEMKGLIKEIETIYAEGLVDASENYQSFMTMADNTDIMAVEDGTMFSYSSLAEAAGFTAVENADGTRSFTRDGAKVTKVTVEDIENSPIGAFINYSLEKKDISKADAKRQKEMFADICTMACKTNDFSMTMQFVGSAVFTGMKANADKQYGTTYDFPSICTKTQAVIDAMSAKMVKLGRGLNSEEIVQLYREVFASGNPVPCPECYVFSRWIGIGGLLDNIKKYQDYYGSMDVADVAKAYLKMKEKVSKFAEEQGISFGKAKGALTSKLTKEYNKLTEKVEKAQNQGEKVKDADLKRLSELEPMMNTVKGMTWLESVYFADSSLKKVNPRYRVPDSVLFDLNNGEAFATQYKEAWAFRTTQGAGYGKAITPYAEAKLGEGVLTTNNTTKTIKSKASGTLDNFFLQQNGAMDKKAKAALDRARMKQKIQAFIGGQRFQSTSDARYENASDYLLAALEMQAMGGMVQVYTKVDGAVPAFSAWGFSINQSLMPLGGGLDANGNVKDTSVGGMNRDVAFENRNKHESAGTITIGVNDNHIRAMFKQWVRDFIIPYHASGGKADVVAELRRIQEGDAKKGKMVRSTDYSRTQGDKVLSDEVLRWQGKTEEEIERIHQVRDARIEILTGGKVDMDVVRSNRFLSALYDKLHGGEWDGVKLAKSKVESQIFPNEFWDQTVSYEESGKITRDYLEYCSDLGFLHRFSGTIPSNGKLVPVNGYDQNGERVQLTDLAYQYDANGQKTDQVEEFFWKVLTDRRMYDNEGNYLPQKVVTLNDTTTDTVTGFAKNNVGKEYNKDLSNKLVKQIKDTTRFSPRDTGANTSATMRDIEISRNFVAYEDDNAINAAVYKKVEDLVARGKYVTIGKGTLKKYTEADALKDDSSARGFIKDIVEDFVGISVYFEHEGQFAEAYLTRDGSNHTAGGVITAKKAAALSRLTDLIRNAEYAYSTKNVKHSNANKRIRGRIDWDGFVAVAMFGEEAYPMVFKIRTIDNDMRSQIYEIAAKNEEIGGTHGGGQQENLPDAQPNYGVAPISGEIVSQPDGKVKRNSDRDDVPTFYSHMARVVDGVKQEKLGAASIVNMLRGKGVKAEEIKWSGIEAWLEGKKSVTKADLQEFIAGSMLQIEEEVLDNKDRPYTEDQQKRLDEYEAKRDEVVQRIADEWKKLTGNDFPIRNAGPGLESAVTQAILEANSKQKKATFEGRLLAKLKSDLKEVIESNDDFGFDSWMDAKRSIHRHRRDFISHYEMSTNDKAIIVKYCNALNAYNELPNMISEADTDRLRAIAREADPLNRKIMEVKHEYNEEAAKYMTNWGQYRLEGGKNYREMLFRIPGSTYSNEAMFTHWKERSGVLAHARVQDLDTFLGKMLFIEEIQSDWHNAGHKAGYRKEGEKTDNMLYKESEKAYEEFYAVVEKMVYDNANWEDDNTVYYAHPAVVAEMFEGNESYFEQYGFTDEQIGTIRSMVAEEAARQAALKTAPQQGAALDAPFKDTYHEYVLKRLLREAAENDYDSIGWTTAETQDDRWQNNMPHKEGTGKSGFLEGYRIEYDQDIPKFLDKYGKKWGTRVGKTVLDNGTEVWSMAITDSMKESVMTEGQPLYSNRDSEGNQLSVEQQEFFKSSVVRDADGKLMIMYHGTANGGAFTVFDGDKLGNDTRTTQIGQGFYFTNMKNEAESYTKNVDIYGKISRGSNPHLHQVYLNITTPFDVVSDTLDIDKVKSVYMDGTYDYFFSNWIPFYLDKKTVNGRTFTKAELQAMSKTDKVSVYVDFLSTLGTKEVLSNMVRAFPYRKQSELLASMKNRLGYDGLVEEFKPGQYQYVAFSSEQVKSVDNKNPTSNPDIRYQDRAEESVSNRSLLANAFEGVAQNDIEKSKIQEYKGKISLINAEERKLNELNEQIKELSFAKGPRDTKKIRELQFEANQAANRISVYDKQLLRLEASKPLQDVLTREKKMAYKKAEQKGKDALAAYKEKTAKTQRELLERWQDSRKKGVESRHKTAMRHKIKDIVNELNQYLLRGTKDRHVPIELQKAVAEALDAVNMDTVGAEERIAKLKAELLKAKTPEQIQEISRKIDHIQEMGDKMNGRLQKLKDAYDQFVNSDDPMIANSHDEVISNKLQSVIDSIGNTPLRDMTLAQLEDVYDMYRMVLTTIRNANKAFKAKKAESISTIAGRVMMEVEQVGGKRKLSMKLLEGIKGFFWNNMKPVYAFEHIGSNAFTEVFNSVRAGEDVWALDVTEARAYYMDQSKKHSFDSWDFGKRFNFTSTSGMEFSLGLEQIMSLYAYSKRDQAAEHLKKGGIVIDETTEITVKTKLGIPVKFNPTEATAYNISDETLSDIIGKLTDEQRAFVDEMQDYLSTVMGAKGNEVSLEMYGIKLFKEKFYFPLKSAHQFMAKAKEQAQGEVKIKNSGFSKETVQKASNPIVLTPFMDVWSSHVNEMSMYHAFVLPMEDFYRVYNYKTPTSETMATESVEMFIQNAYGKAATKYIDQLLKDLNGGAMSDPRETFAKSLMSRFKKAKVMGSLSVVVQQPSAIGRAFALVDPRHFRPTKDGMNHKQLWEELKQYAPVAIIKEMGYFDTGMGMATKDFIKAKEYSSFKEKAKALFTDENYRDELISKAPAIADELTWCAIWNAVKRETVSTHKNLRPGSEEFLKAAGERFTEVVTKTQVYDSVLARSANMRAKTGLMSMVTSFMAEPTTTINMLEDAILQAKRGKKGYAVRAFASVAVSIILNNALVSLVYAGRDDDEDETFLEKYLQSLTSGTLDDINPLTYYPFLKDMWSLLQGYDIERADMSLVSDFADAAKALVKAYTSEDGDVAGAWWDIAGAVANIGGVPLDNFRREINGAINFFGTVIDDVNGRDTTWGSLGDTVGEAVKSSLPVVGWFSGESKTDKLYDAIVSGDTAYVDRLKGSYDSETAYNIAVRKALRENDPRIHEAAVARMRGDLTTYTRIAKEIIAEKHFSQDYVVAAINAEINALDKGEATTSKPKASGLYTADDFAVAVAKGDASMANAVKVDIIRTAEKNGKTAEEAEKSFVSSATSACKELFLDGDINVSQAIDALVTYCGKTEDDAMADVQYWAFKQDYPDVYVDDQWFDSYYEKVADSGLPIDVYMEYRNAVSTITGDGKKEKRMAVINSLPITSAQKDALYLAEGWAESKLYEAPWH